MTRVPRLISVTAQKRPPVCPFCVRKGKASAGVAPGAFCGAFVLLCLVYSCPAVPTTDAYLPRNPPQNACYGRDCAGMTWEGT